ncbi:GM13573, partial [Drosophila sechellia]
DLSTFKHTYAQTDCLLLLVYEQGPLACMRIFGGTGLRGDIHNSGLTADVIADKYLRLQQPDRAVNVLAALNWETYGAMCLITLHKIANYVFFGGDQRRPRIELMARALKTFAHTLSEETKDEFSDQVYDLKRRFCFYLLRKNLFAEAFEIAQDVADYDIFMDLYNLTKCISSLSEFAQVAFSQAAAIIHEEDRANGNLSLTCDLRSESACSLSTCSDMLRGQGAAIVPDTGLGAGQPQNQQILKNYVPPLPSFKSKVFNAEMIKINIPKPELRPPLPKVSIAPPTSSLASLTLKSNSLQQAPAKNLHPNGNVWSQDVPDQTVGLPMPSSPLPRLPPSNIPDQSAQLGQFSTMPASPPPTASYQPKFYQHPLVSGNIPAMLPSLTSEDYQKRLLQKKPTASILSNPANPAPTNGEAPATPAKSQTAEKNKVKFSDTIQVAVVPEIPRKEKPMPPKRNGYSRPAARHLTNPKKELADSLPLCHPNDEYLKDFNPITTNVTKPPIRRREEEPKSSSKGGNSSSSSSIKVVHFGVV